MVGLGRLVLHELGLVQDQSGPGLGLVGLGVETEERIGGHHDVVFGSDRCQRAGGPPLGVGDGCHPQVGGETCRLIGPVGHHGGRGDHQERPGNFGGAASRGPLVLGMQDQGQGLHGFAQAHIVRQDAAEIIAPEHGQPFEALPLVRAERRLESGGQCRGFGLGDVQQRVHPGIPGIGAFGDGGELLEFLPKGGLVAGDLQVGVLIVEGPGLGHEVAQPIEELVLEGEVGLIGHEHAALPAGEGPQDVGERNTVLPDGDHQTEVEPVTFLRFDGGHRQLGGFGEFTVGRWVAGGTDLEAIDLFQQRQ